MRDAVAARRAWLGFAAIALGGTLALDPALLEAERAAGSVRSDRGDASAVLIRRSDLPSGWSRRTSMASHKTGGANCLSGGPPSSAGAKSGFVKLPSHWLLSEAVIFRSQSYARRFLARARSPHFQACLDASYAKPYRTDVGSGPLVIRAGPTAFGWYFGIGHVCCAGAPRIYIHYAFARRGRAVVWLAQGSVEAPFPVNQTALLRLMLSRLR